MSTRAYIEAQEGAGTDSGVVAEALERSFQAKLDDVATRLLGKKLVGPKSSPVMSRALRELDRRRRACESRLRKAMDGRGHGEKRLEAVAEYRKAKREYFRAAEERRRGGEDPGIQAD